MTHDGDRLDWIVEGHSWTPDPVMRDTLFRIGVIAAAFSNVDFLASKLAVQASRLEAYAAVRSRYPETLRMRLGFWREVLKRPGPLHSRRRLGLLLLNRYRELAASRNVVAHSRLRPLTSRAVRFDRWAAVRDGPATFESTEWTLVELARQSHRAARFSRRCTLMAEALGRSGLLPPLDGVR